MISITVQTKDGDIQLSLEAAREVHTQLQELFGANGITKADYAKGLTFSRDLAVELTRRDHDK